MTFTTLTFLLFFSLVFPLYWSLRTVSSQNLFLLVTSYVFYGWWDPRFCLLMFASTLVDYIVGIKIDTTDVPSKRLRWLWLAMLSNLGLLGFFKYYNFFYASFADLLSLLGFQAHYGTLSIILPVGISFYTFQSMSYSLDIYRGRLKSTRDPVHFFTFVSFFPQLVAGPIERAKDLLPQFAEKRRFDEAAAREGCRYILWGFFQKLAIADNMALWVDPVYGSYEAATGATLAFSTVCFSVQIYADFAGYSCIAIGLARLLGIRLSRNFAYPYFSQSIGEFWRRWHITLSSWFRDYVYITLGGNRVSRRRLVFNVMITFLVSGLWHGANWTFVVWGALNGFALIPEALSSHQGKIDKEEKPMSLGLHFGSFFRMAGTYIIICITWVFFRAPSLEAAWTILLKIFGGVWALEEWGRLGGVLFQNGWSSAPLVLAVLMFLFEWKNRAKELTLEFSDRSRSLRLFKYSVIFWLTLIWTQRSGQFIYFQF